MNPKQANSQVILNQDDYAKGLVFYFADGFPETGECFDKYIVMELTGGHFWVCETAAA